MSPPGPRAFATSGRRYPLLFFVTKERDVRFGGTERVEGARHPLRFDDGTTGSALYYEGVRPHASVRWASPS